MNENSKLKEKDRIESRTYVIEEIIPLLYEFPPEKFETEGNESKFGCCNKERRLPNEN